MREFFHMGGYAYYVWTAYGAAAIVLVLNILLPVLQHRKLLREVKQHKSED